MKGIFLNFLFVNWNPDQIAFTIPLQINIYRWMFYCFVALSMLVVYYYVHWLYKNGEIKSKLFHPFLFNSFMGILAVVGLYISIFCCKESWGSVWRTVGPLEFRWYSLCWLIGLLGAFFIVRWLYQQAKIKDELFDPLFFYCFVGILVGARLGHCLFYEPDYFLSSGTHILEMLFPFRMTANDGWQCTGYQGLASHGGTLGLMLALLLYVRRSKLPLMKVLDFIAIATPFTAGFIRLGNLMNSEIIGKATDLPWAFIFEKVDMTPRHPGQLYEAIAYFILLFIGFAIYMKHKERVGTGFFFGLCLTYIFAFRFFIEYTKENQEAFEDGMIFNMGQLLSVPFVALGIYCMLRKPHPSLPTREG